MSVISFRKECCASEQPWCSGKENEPHSTRRASEHTHQHKLLTIHMGLQTTLGHLYTFCTYIYTYIYRHTHSHLHSQMREEVATVWIARQCNEEVLVTWKGCYWAFWKRMQEKLKIQFCDWSLSAAVRHLVGNAFAVPFQFRKVFVKHFSWA